MREEKANGQKLSDALNIKEVAVLKAGARHVSHGLSTQKRFQLSFDGCSCQVIHKVVQGFNALSLLQILHVSSWNKSVLRPILK